MEAEICPSCEKVVYDAEGFPAGKMPIWLLVRGKSLLELWVTTFLPD